MKTFQALSRCRCGRRPPLRFSEDRVQAARRERQTALFQEVRCSCGHKYWMRAHEIANAVPSQNGNGAAPAPTPVTANGTGGHPWPASFPERAVRALTEAGIRDMTALSAVEDWTGIPGIGAATAKQMRTALPSAA